MEQYFCQYQCSRGLRRGSAAACWGCGFECRRGDGRIFCECCILWGRGLCFELITRPEEFYRLWCVAMCDLETSRMRRSWPTLGRSATKKNKYSNIYKTAQSGCSLWKQLDDVCLTTRLDSKYNYCFKVPWSTRYWLHFNTTWALSTLYMGVIMIYWHYTRVNQKVKTIFKLRGNRDREELAHCAALTMPVEEFSHVQCSALYSVEWQQRGRKHGRSIARLHHRRTMWRSAVSLGRRSETCGNSQSYVGSIWTEHYKSTKGLWVGGKV